MMGWCNREKPAVGKRIKWVERWQKRGRVGAIREITPSNWNANHVILSIECSGSKERYRLYKTVHRNMKDYLKAGEYKPFRIWVGK